MSQVARSGVSDASRNSRSVNKNEGGQQQAAMQICIAAEGISITA
jgi:hypothetical protein